MLTCHFAGFDCAVQFARYQDNGNVAIQLVDAEDGSPIATASVNMGTKVPDDQVAIKGWSENAGIESALEDAGIIGECVSILPSGFVYAQVHRLTDEAIEYAAAVE